MSNKIYKDERGVKFSEDRKILLKVPRGILEYDVPEGTEKIGKEAFNKKIRKVTLPKSLKKILPRAFYDCQDLEQVVIPDSVEEIGESAFSWCLSLKEVVLPKALKEIEAETFDSCMSLERVVIPDTVTKIGIYAFKLCDKLTEIVLPKSLETISDIAFDCCTGLSEIQLPESLQTITGNPFRGCYVVITSLSPNFKVIDNALYGDNGKRLIYAHAECERFCIVEGTEVVGVGALHIHTDELVIPASVKKFCHQIYSCHASRIIFKGTVERLPCEMIYDLVNGLRHVVIPRGTKKYYDKMFGFTIDESD